MSLPYFVSNEMVREISIVATNNWNFGQDKKDFFVSFFTKLFPRSNPQNLYYILNYKQNFFQNK